MSKVVIIKKMGLFIDDYLIITVIVITQILVVVQMGLLGQF